MANSRSKLPAAPQHDSEQDRLKKELELLSLAKDWLERPIERKQTVAKHHEKDSRFAREALRTAIAKDWIRVSINKFPDQPFAPDDEAHSKQLSKELEAHYDVAAVEVIPVVKPASSRPYDLALHSDRVHYILGRALGEGFRTSIGPGDRIGLSSGRGVRYTVNAVLKPVSAKDVTLMSLTGALEMRAHALHSVIMDGDLNVAALAACFSEVRVSMAACDIADQRAKPPWFKKPDAKMPAKAIVGIGIVEGRNRFCRQPVRFAEGAGADSAKVPLDARKASSEAPPVDFQRRPKPLDGATEELDLLEKLIRSAKADGHPCVVAEVANCFFLVESPRGPVKQRDQIERAIEAVNLRLQCVSLEQLAQIPQLFIVAGTAEKAEAIRTLLRKGLKVQKLVTDSGAAEVLREAPKKP